jgi:hypothetical protein
MSFVVVSVFLIAGPGIAQNAVPMLINYQGELREPATGEPVPDGEYNVTFLIYDLPFGGTSLWQSSHSSINGNPVPVQDGLFSVLLGSGTGPPLSASLFNGADRWLEIVVEGETLEPRQRLASVPYSIVSENSRLLDGQEASSFASASHLHSGDDIVEGIVSEKWIDTAITRDSELAAHAADAAAHHKKTTTFAELTDTATDAQIPNDITIQYAKNAEDADTLDGFDSTYFLSPTSDHGRSGVAADLYEGTETLSRRYVNTTGPDRVTGSHTLAMFSVENSGTGPGLSSTAQGPAIVGTALADSGYGVQGFADGAGGRGVAGSAGGKDGRGVWASAPGEGGRGVYGITTDTGNVENYGGYFESWGQNGRGGYGKATGEAGIGLEGESEGEEGVGVRGQGKLAGVHCEGDLVVTGAYRGTLGKIGGAPFPRPAYDSGWQSIKQGETITLTHNIGGNPDSYVVDLQFMSLGGNVHHKGYGGKVEGGEPYPITLWMGAWWQRLTDESIQVQRYTDDDMCPGVRVRIWVYN